MNSNYLNLIRKADKTVKKYFVYKNENSDDWRSYHKEVIEAVKNKNTTYRFYDDCDSLAITVLEYAVYLGVPKTILSRAIVNAYPKGKPGPVEGHMVCVANVEGVLYYFGDTFGQPVEINSRNHDILMLDWVSDKKGWKEYMSNVTTNTSSKPRFSLGQSGESLIKHYESLKLKAYLCPANVWTIGWGHTKTAKQGMVITRPQAQALFDQDIKSFVDAVNSAIKVNITQNQFDALVSLAFNIGIGNFTKSTLVRRINSRASDVEVHNQFRRWIFANGRRLQGLANRREAEILLYRGLPWKVSSTASTSEDKAETVGVSAEPEYIRHELDAPVRNTTVIGSSVAGIAALANEGLTWVGNNATTTATTLTQSADELKQFVEYVPVVQTGIGILMAAALIFVVWNRITKILESRK